jgi:osmotically inducible protein OsmC
MPVSTAVAEWKGKGTEGRGTMRPGSIEIAADYTLATRMRDVKGTNPEELIGAAHAGCFSMSLAAQLEMAGYDPQLVRTTADVRIENQEGGPAITGIKLKAEARVPGLEPEIFYQQAVDAVKTCPVSKALSGTKVELEAKLIA